MAELLRKLDIRTRSDADGNNYYVVFCARKSDNASGFPGHAFVVWGLEDSQAQMSSQQSFGFYPDPTDDSKPLFGTVTGTIVNEATKLSPSDLLTARLIVQLNRQPYLDSQGQISAWQTTDYNLYSRNCISFAHAVAVAIALFPPDPASLEFPESYLEDLIAATTSH